jgi:hypothetical protein
VLGRRYNLRVYVLVTSRAPLRVWFYNVRARRLALAM